MAFVISKKCVSLNIRVILLEKQLFSFAQVSERKYNIRISDIGKEIIQCLFRHMPMGICYE